MAKEESVERRGQRQIEGRFTAYRAVMTSVVLYAIVLCRTLTYSELCGHTCIVIGRYFETQ